MGEEGCLSIPRVPMQVSRAQSVILRWTDLEGSNHEAEFEGVEAVLVQHEYDHLDGIVIYDRVNAANGGDDTAHDEEGTA